MTPTDKRYPAGVGSGIRGGKGRHWAKCRFATQLPLAVGVFGVALLLVALGPGRCGIGVEPVGVGGQGG